MAFVEMDFSSGGGSMKEWQYFGETTLRNAIALPSQFNELFIKIYATSGTYQGRGACWVLPKIAIEQPMLCVSGGGNSTYFKEISWCIADGAISINQYTYDANDLINVACMKVYYR